MEIFGFGPKTVDLAFWQKKIQTFTSLYSPLWINFDKLNVNLYQKDLLNANEDQKMGKNEEKVEKMPLEAEKNFVLLGVKQLPTYP